MSAGDPGDDDPVALDLVALCLAGRISPPVMLARMVLGGASVEAVRSALAGRAGAAALLAFFEPRAASMEGMRAMLQGVDHAGFADPAGIAAQFDAAVAAAPEASVAAYSLGDPALLGQATAELLAWLDGEDLFRDGMDVVDLGCGIGRVAAALAPRARSVLGLDVAPGMVAEAVRRHGGEGGLRFALANGCDLDALPDAGCDLVLAVDCFPYLFQAGVAEAHVRGAARALRPGGALVVLNLTYAADPAPDRARMMNWAAGCALRPGQDGARPFTLWDGAAFVFHAR